MLAKGDAETEDDGHAEGLLVAEYLRRDAVAKVAFERGGRRRPRHEVRHDEQAADEVSAAQVGAQGALDAVLVPQEAGLVLTSNEW